MEDAGRGDDAGDAPELVVRGPRPRRRPRRRRRRRTGTRSRVPPAARIIARGLLGVAGVPVDHRDRRALAGGPRRPSPARSRSRRPSPGPFRRASRSSLMAASVRGLGYELRPSVTEWPCPGPLRRRPYCDTHVSYRRERDAHGRRQGRHRHRVGQGDRQGHGAAPRQGRGAGRGRRVEGRRSWRETCAELDELGHHQPSASSATSSSRTRSTRWSRRPSSASAASTGSINNAQTFRPLVADGRGERAGRRRVLRLRREGHACGRCRPCTRTCARRAGVASSTSRRRWASPAAPGSPRTTRRRKRSARSTRTAAREWARRRHRRERDRARGRDAPR